MFSVRSPAAPIAANLLKVMGYLLIPLTNAPHCIYFPKAAYLAELQSAVQPENPALVTVET